MARHHHPTRPAGLLGTGGIIFLTGFGLLSAYPAAAQTLILQSGDNVTVSAAGTQGIYQGKPISNTTNAYTIVEPLAGSSFTLNGGTLSNASPNGEGLFNAGGSVFINGGSVIGGNYGAGFFDASGTAVITGGSFSESAPNGNAVAADSGSIKITGGTFSGGDATFAATYGGLIDLFGTFSQTAPITGGSGTITGTLLNGQPLNASYFAGGNGVGTGTIEFNVGAAPVPEFSGAGSLGIGLAFLGLVGMAGRRRARQAADQ